jgi:hypothetical protein
MNKATVAAAAAAADQGCEIAKWASAKAEQQ